MHRGLQLLYLSLLWVMPAEAACLDGTPTSCNGGGLQDVCVLTTSFATDDTINCNLDRNGGGNGSDVHAENNSGVIEIFGDDAAGNTFCCELTPAGGVDLFMSINGDNSNVPDRIDLSFGLVDELSSPNAGNILACNVFASDGDDTLIGSSTSSFYEEDLAGGDGNDTISGRGGDDFIYGNDGDDDLTGGSGGDVIRGGAGDDILDGGPGNDALIGDLETGAGAHGRDELLGRAGADVLCSGGMDPATGTEVLEGGDDNDILWSGPHRSAPTPVDNATIDGGADNGIPPQDRCQVMTDPGCENPALYSDCY